MGRLQDIQFQLKRPKRKTGGVASKEIEMKGRSAEPHRLIMAPLEHCCIGTSHDILGVHTQEQVHLVGSHWLVHQSRATVLPPAQEAQVEISEKEQWRARGEVLAAHVVQSDDG